MRLCVKAAEDSSVTTEVFDQPRNVRRVRANENPAKCRVQLICCNFFCALHGQPMHEKQFCSWSVQTSLPDVFPPVILVERFPQMAIDVIEVQLVSLRLLED